MMRWLRQVVRARPRMTVLVLAVLVLAGGSGGLVGYSLWEWETAQALAKQERPHEALRHLRWCLTVWPRSPAVHLLAARLTRLTGDLKGAEDHLNRCLKLQHGATEAVQLEFLLLRAQAGEADEVAEPLIGLVEQHHPETVLILETLARYYMVHLRYQPAYAYLCRWIEETPDAAKPYWWRGWVYERMNNSEKAMKDYLRALELDPSLFLIRLRVAEMLLEDNNPLDAIPHLERLRQEYPDRGDVMAVAGRCHLLRGQHEEARALLEAAQQKLPHDPGLLLQLATLELQVNQPAKAEPWLRKILELDPSDTEARYALVTALQLQGRKKEAAATLEEHKQYEDLVQRVNKLLREEGQHPTNDPDVFAEIGRLLLRINRERLGLYWLEQALARNSQHQRANKILADYYEGKGELDKAAFYRRQAGGDATGP